MNADDIRKMEAGRETDSWVAEKVMGWKRVSHETHGSWWIRGIAPDGQTLYATHTWSPSTDIAAAWQVVEKMESMGGHVIISSPGRWCESGGWWRVQVSAGKGRGAVCAEDTAPLAICKAVLLAVETQ
jgi:hypothetical protein